MRINLTTTNPPGAQRSPSQGLSLHSLPGTRGDPLFRERLTPTRTPQGTRRGTQRISHNPQPAGGAPGSLGPVPGAAAQRPAMLLSWRRLLFPQPPPKARRRTRREGLAAKKAMLLPSPWPVPATQVTSHNRGSLHLGLGVAPPAALGPHPRGLRLRRAAPPWSLPFSSRSRLRAQTSGCRTSRRRRPAGSR